MEISLYKDFIGVYKNAFTKEWCDNAIKWFNVQDKAGHTINRQESEGNSPLEKKDQSIVIPYNTYTWEDDGLPLNNEFKEIFFSSVYPFYKQENPLLEKISEHYIRGFKIQKTIQGGGYHLWHCEQARKEVASRLAVWTLYLNDDFEAGETEFLNQGLRVKPETGTVCIFPAGYTHVHRGNPPIGGTKYIATGWLEF